MKNLLVSLPISYSRSQNYINHSFLIRVIGNWENSSWIRGKIITEILRLEIFKRENWREKQNGQMNVGSTLCVPCFLCVYQWNLISSEQKPVGLVWEHIYILVGFVYKNTNSVVALRYRFNKIQKNNMHAINTW